MSTPFFIGKGELMKLKKKILPVLLSALFACSSVTGGYLSATAVPVQAAATATWGLMEVIEALFASFGLSYMTYEMFDNWTDGNNALQPDWQNIYDSIEDSYEKQWTVINGGGGTDPTPTPELEKPPHFSEIVKTAMASGVLELGKESYGMIKTWMDTNMTASYEIGQLLCDKTIPDGMNIDPEYITGGSVKALFHSSRGVCNYDYNATDSIIYSDKSICFLQSDGSFYICTRYTQHSSMNYFKNGVLCRSDASLNSINGFIRSYESNSKKMYKYEMPYISYMSSYPVFDTDKEAWEYLYGNNTGEEKEVKAPIWVAPELQDTYKNAGKLEFPENTPQSINVPNIDQLAQLAQQLQNASSLDAGSQTDAATSAMQKYLASLQTKTDPDPGTSPKPDPDPKPSVTPTPDKPDSGNTGSEDDKESFTADLKELFPFCIPFDLIHALKILSAEPETPYFEVPVKIHSFGIDVDYTFVLDFEQFNMIAKVLRTVETLGFIVLLIWVTRDLIKG